MKMALFLGIKYIAKVMGKFKKGNSYEHERRNR
jgi:hypothetical protein